MNKNAKYLLLRDAGSAPAEIYLIAQADGLDEIACIRLLREIFQLSLAEAKEVTHTADGSARSLTEYQERLIPILEYAIEESNAETAVQEQNNDKV